MELIGDERGDGVQRQRSVDRIVQNRMADPFQHDQSLLRGRNLFVDLAAG